MPPIFIDTNIFMYAIGASHPNKAPCEQLVRACTTGEIEPLINTEVLQEILYRYTAIGKPAIGFQLFDLMIDTMPTIWPVERADMVLARRLQERHRLPLRDALHLATMQRYRVRQIYSYDRDFDELPGIRRLEPA